MYLGGGGGGYDLGMVDQNGVIEACSTLKIDEKVNECFCWYALHWRGIETRNDPLRIISSVSPWASL